MCFSVDPDQTTLEKIAIIILKYEQFSVSAYLPDMVIQGRQKQGSD